MQRFVLPTRSEAANCLQFAATCLKFAARLDQRRSVSRAWALSRSIAIGFLLHSIPGFRFDRPISAP
jgi:hypothetical protein